MIVDPLLAGLLGTVALFLLLFLGMPIAFALLLVGFAGTSFLASPGAALPVVARTVYEVAAYYPYTVIPLFIVMGGFAGSSGMTQELYGAFDKWLRRLPGGLGIATIGACAGFAAVSGSSVATAATMGTVALPEMRRFRYDPRLATGCIAAGGTLGFLIPPSIGFVVYGMLTEQSIGKLLVAGMLPGIILAGAGQHARETECPAGRMGAPGPFPGGHGRYLPRLFHPDGGRRRRRLNPIPGGLGKRETDVAKPVRRPARSGPNLRDGALSGGLGQRLQLLPGPIDHTDAGSQLGDDP
jgi:hypothetical protein